MQNFPNTYRSFYQSNYDCLFDLLVIAKEIGVSNEIWFQDGINSLSQRWDERKFQYLLRKCLNRKELPSLLDNTFKIPMSDDDIEALKGDFSFGKVVGTDIDVGLTEKALNMHTLISGSSGFGKTSALIALSKSIQENSNIRQVFIDPKSQAFDYRILSRFHNTIILPLHVLKLNPFGPIKNVPRKAIMEQSIEILADSYGLLEASQGIISDHVERVFAREEFPCFKDVSRSIFSDKALRFGRKQGYLDSISVRDKSTILSLGEVFDCRQDYFNSLYDKNVIFEIGGIPAFSQGTLARFIIMKYSLYKTYNCSNNLDTLLGFDEAQAAIFSKILENRNRVPTVATLATQARAYGLGLIVLCQNPATKIITEMLSNSATHLCFHLGGTEIRGMAENLGLTYDQAQMINHLPPQHAIFKSSFNYTEPVMIKINDTENERISDEKIEGLMREKWKELNSKVTKTEKAETFQAANPTTEPEKIDQTNLSLQDKEIFNKQLEKDDSLLLQDIKLRPYEFKENRYENTILSRQRAHKSLERLCRFGYIREIKISTGKAGGKPTLLQPTEKTRKLLDISYAKGKGSCDHVFWQHLIKHFARKYNLKCKIEDMYADVSIVKNDVHVAIEISINITNIEQNIKRNLNNGFQEVWIVVKDIALRTKVLNQFKEINFMKRKTKVFLFEDIVFQIKNFSEIEEWKN